jgi:hypothetical protein
MKTIEKTELKELLNQNWLTHDSMWFYHCLQEFGIEKTNKVNLAALKSMAMVEARRIKKVLGIKKIESFEELKNFSIRSFDLVMPDFMKFTFSFPFKNVLQWKWESCFAYRGIKKMGVIDRYQCGIIPRMECWFESLGIKYRSTPKIDGCLMHNNGSCSGEFRFYFEE